METRFLRYKMNKVVMNKKDLEVIICYPTLGVLGLRNTQCKVDMTFSKLFCFSLRDAKDILRKQRQKGLSPPTASGRINFNKEWKM